MPFNDIQNTAKNIAKNPFAENEKASKPKAFPPVEIELDVLAQLLECSFRGISFPVESLDMDVSHDVIQHKRMDRDGAKLEDTGLGAFTYQIKAPFCNTIARGPMETWDNLYPDTKNKMLEALSDRSTGDFIHPELGLRRCKCLNFRTGLDPNYRGGIVISFTLVEDTEEDDAVVITQNSTLALAVSSAISLDAALGNLTPPPVTGLEEDGFKSFEDAMRKISGAFDQVGLLQKQVIGKIDRVIGRVNKLTETAVGTVTNLGTFPDQLISSLLRIKKNALIQSKPLGFFQTQAPITVGQLALLLGNSVLELINLNPGLASAVSVPKFTLVRYYKK